MQATRWLPATRHRSLNNSAVLTLLLVNARPDRDDAEVPDGAPLSDSTV
ncbi:hypothetical protein ACFT2C_14780 [Promicromonospora sp. NPDC057138]